MAAVVVLVTVLYGGGAAAKVDQAGVSVSEQLTAALGIAPRAITKETTAPVLEAADTVLKFPGGVAEIDTKTGRLIALVNRGGLETGSAPCSERFRT